MRYYSLVAIFMVQFIFTSCENFLEESPESSISTDQFFKTSEDATTAINAIYQPLTDQFDDFQLTIATTDDGFSASGAGAAAVQEMWRYYYTPNNTRVFTGFWGREYDAINRANLAIDRIPNIEMDEKQKNKLLGEARYLRAYIYFKLVQFFGEVPLVTSPTESSEGVDVPKAPVEDVYAQIIDDLNFASSNLFAHDVTEKGRASSEAALGLLAKVYLTKHDWQMAFQKTNEIINAGNFNLVSNFQNLFLSATEDNEEVIIAFQYSETTGYGYPSKTYLPKNTIPGWRGLNAFAPTQNLYDSYQVGDLRRDVTLFNSWTTGDGQTLNFEPWFRKFWDLTVDNTNDAGIDVPILRFADILLMNAEASNEINGPKSESIEEVNMIRRRAYGFDINTGSSIDLPTGLSQEEFRQAIWQERRWEFAGEYHRWFDLKRTGRLMSVVSAWLDSVDGTGTFEEKHLLYPIPQTEIDANPNLTQNPGW